MLTVKDLSMRFGGLQALDRVSFMVNEGETVGLIGPNGAGKTTLFRTISGLLRPTHGRLEFLGHDLSKLSPERIVRLGIVHVPEGRQLFLDLTVKENLWMGSYTRRDAAVREDWELVLSYFPVLRERLAQPAGTLSGGEQQMLAIGRALMARPRLLLLDEPSLGLAPLTVQALFRFLKDLNSFIACDDAFDPTKTVACVKKLDGLPALCLRLQGANPDAVILCRGDASRSLPSALGHSHLRRPGRLSRIITVPSPPAPLP